ncbi:M14 family zinc carboxypeptidase [Niabella aquatica]
MKKLFFFLVCPIFSIMALAQLPATKFERTKGIETPAYPEIIDWWQRADAASSKIKMLTMGMTDAGEPLHLVVISNTGLADFQKIRRENKLVILVNNGIHAGEPDGIDASMLLAKDIVSGKIKLNDKVVLAVIPVYNIGGCLNRSEKYRVDQNGPQAFGFRGNAQNLDLNRLNWRPNAGRIQPLQKALMPS